MNVTRVPSLDGLRAVSIILVLMGHLRGIRGAPRFLETKIDLGYLGVRIFFVISGFIITYLLMKQERQGSISLKTFYIRRAKRIFPLAYLYMAVCAIWIASPLAHPGDFLCAATYSINWKPHPIWDLGHLWSLSIEEQFYLLWPLVISRFGTRIGLRVAIVVMAISPILRIGILLFAPGLVWSMNYAFPTVMDALATGCALALLQKALRHSAVYNTFQSSAALPVFIALSICVAISSTKLNALVGVTMLNISAALAIDWCIQHHDGRIGSVLNSAPLVQLGFMSYAIYIWQQPFMDHQSHAWFLVFPLNIVLIMSIASLAHFAIERQYHRLRITPRRSRFSTEDYLDCLPNTKKKTVTVILANK